MVLLVRFISVSIFLIWCQPASAVITLAAVAAVGGIVSATISISMNMKVVIDNSYRIFGSQADRNKGRKYYLSSADNDVIDQFIDLRRENREGFVKIIDMVQEELAVPEIIYFRQLLGKFFDQALMIDENYKDVVKFADRFLEYHPEYLKNTTLQKLYSGNMENLIRDARRILVKNPYENILYSFTKHGKDFLYHTNALQSPQQFLGQLLEYYFLTEQKAFLATTYCYHILERLDKKTGIYESAIIDLRDEFAESLNSTVTIFKSYMQTYPKSLSTEFFRANPSEHVKDETYTELERVYQKFVIRQDSLVPAPKFWNPLLCKPKCSDFSEVPKTYCRDDGCHQADCEGSLHDCQMVIDTKATICLSRDSNRKYDYLMYGTHNNGRNVTCSKDRLVDVDVHRICNECLCTCADKSSYSDRFFCRKMQYSNFAANYVITGVRFKKSNHTIYLEIQEGLLLPNGQIQLDSIRWVPADSAGCANETIEMLWPSQRQIALTQTKLPKENRVLTGMWMTPDHKKNIVFMGSTHPFDFTSGKIIQEGLSRVHYTTDNYQDELNLEERSIPTQAQTMYGLEKTDEGKYVKFQTSAMVDDAGQSTIPFLDIQDVAPNPPVPLVGFGTYHKATSQTDGGFIGLKVFTYDFANALRPDLPADFDAAKLYTPKGAKPHNAPK